MLFFYFRVGVRILGLVAAAVLEVKKKIIYKRSINIKLIKFIKFRF